MLVGGQPGTAIAESKQALCYSGEGSWWSLGKCHWESGKAKYGRCTLGFIMQQRSNGLDLPIVPWMDLKNHLNAKRYKMKYTVMPFMKFKYMCTEQQNSLQKCVQKECLQTKRYTFDTLEKSVKIREEDL